MVINKLIKSGMSSSNDIAWLLLVIGLLIWVGRLILEIKTLESEIMRWDVRFGRLLEHLNELEIFNHPEYADHYAGNFEQTSYYD